MQKLALCNIQPNNLPDDYRIFDPKTICPYDFDLDSIDFSQYPDKIINLDTEEHYDAPLIYKRLIVNNGSSIIELPSDGSCPLFVGKVLVNDGTISLIGSVLATRNFAITAGTLTCYLDIVADEFVNGTSGSMVIIGNRIFVNQIRINNNVRFDDLVVANKIHIRSDAHVTFYGGVYIDDYRNIIVENEQSYDDIFYGGMQINYLALTNNTPMPSSGMSVGLVDLKQDNVDIPTNIAEIKYLKTNGYSYTNSYCEIRYVI